MVISATSANHFVGKWEFIDAVTGSKSQSAVSEELGRIFMLLVNKYCGKTNWSNYPQQVKDELKSNALHDLVKVYDKFDETMPNPNPFAYYTQVVYRSFCKTMNKEKAYMNFKTFLFQSSDNTNPALYRKHVEKYDGINRYLETEDNDDIDMDFDD